ncbi:type II toxin-antitoxin system antitoxin, RelB/DinJ family [uncultured Anaerococcus sp.]|uniref:type II toxin-antitoxin system antitoxin, RelB/DinJ family n=1 Tax=uncultured Anaerococcus sp. TaxID=293428 RepID=UPI00280B0B69|nr:type II toxin-antitoxin system antitoxin, RelB/DinJ family [uncultured Anaerococcus sp.]MDU5149080.1 type II toxin-antitoxin system antitoxin, RelB/DinJ family [Anaerococcus prevotii]
MCSEIGISLSSDIIIYLKKLYREYRIILEVSANPFYSEKNIKYLEEKFEEYKSGKMNQVGIGLIKYEDY